MKSEVDDQSSLCLSFEDAVRWSGLTERLITGAIRSGELLVVRRGRRLFIIRDDLARFVQRHCVAVPEKTAGGGAA